MFSGFLVEPSTTVSHDMTWNRIPEPENNQDESGPSGQPRVGIRWRSKMWSGPRVRGTPIGSHGVAETVYFYLHFYRWEMGHRETQGKWWCEKYIFNRPMDPMGSLKPWKKPLCFPCKYHQNEWCSIIMLVYRSVTMFLKLIHLFVFREGNYTETHGPGWFESPGMN